MLYEQIMCTFIVLGVNKDLFFSGVFPRKVVLGGGVGLFTALIVCKPLHSDMLGSSDFL